MKAIKRVFILVIIATTTLCCWAKLAPRAGRQIIVKGNNEFALELYSKLRTQQGNLFLSPYSISTALAMTYAGAHGQTEVQMAETLRFPTSPKVINYDINDTSVPLKSTECAWPREHFHRIFGDIIKDLNARDAKGDYELTVANALWSQKGYEILKEFAELIKTSYQGGINEVNFVQAAETARQKINTWVEKETKGKIKNIIQQGAINNLTRLILTNAIYFKGNWASQFKTERTRNAPFTLISGEKTDVPMMNQTGKFNYMKTEDFQALELPYVDNELSMIIFLPKKIDGLADFEQTLTAKSFSNWLSQLNSCRVAVSVPKFTMTSRFSLTDVLKSMGMPDAFSSETADFSAINGRRDLFISTVIHKAFVDVNEEGTEAAAATGVVIGVTSMPPAFRANHPFLFLIRDNLSGSILFIGRVMNPQAQSDN